jgi:putative ABC transport system permease protein
MIGLAIIPITSVALFVAGIVVMNMMLVSVTERTQEIGIRKSLGARKTDILNQILFESSCLCLLGGAVGLGISYLGTHAMSAAFGSPVVIPPFYVALALTVSGIIGIGAGLYPAYMAARLPPVVAMRTEI